MRAGRRFLYWGVFFLALGGIMVAIQLGLVDEARVVDALRLWPLAVIALGLAIIARRTRVSPGAWLVAATLPGLMLGGAIAAGPRVTLDCTDPARPVLSTADGTLADAGSIDVSSACGSLVVATAPGSAWRVETGDPGQATARISSTAGAVTVDAGTTGSVSFGRSTSTTWRATLPTSPMDRLRLELSAGDGTVDLAGAHVTDLTLNGNATQLHVDLRDASVARLSAAVHLGGLWLSLPRANLSGTLEVAIGELKVCLPPDVGLHVRRTSQLGTVTYEGFEQRATEWQSPGYDQAPFHVDLTATPDLGGIEFDPIGGCR